MSTSVAEHHKLASLLVSCEMMLRVSEVQHQALTAVFHLPGLEMYRQAVEELVQKDPRKAAELRRLQQTVSTPDLSVVFPGKERLYRSEKQRRAILLPWIRYGIAAAVLAAVALLLLPRTPHRTALPVAAAPKKIPPSSAPIL